MGFFKVANAIKQALLMIKIIDAVVKATYLSRPFYAYTNSKTMNNKKSITCAAYAAWQAHPLSYRFFATFASFARCIKL